MGLDAVLPATPKLGQALISTANTARDGTGTIGTVVTAGASGTELYYVRIKGRGTTTAGMIRLFLHDGTSFRGLLKEIPVGAVTPSGTVATFEATVSLLHAADGVPGAALLLPNLWSLRASTHNAESFDVIAVGADY